MEGTSAAAAAPAEQHQSSSASRAAPVVGWPTNSIFRASANIRWNREPNFEPKLVSIGPHYHGRKELQPVEDLKRRCVRELHQKPVSVQDKPRHSGAGIPRHRCSSLYNVPVERSMQGTNGITVNMPLYKFTDLGETARAFYKEEFQHTSDNFVQMLYLDSCFIIRTILYLSQKVVEFMAFLDVPIKDVRSDLLLLENQIPLFFIKEVYKSLFPPGFYTEFPTFNDVLVPFLSLDMPWRINLDAMSSEAVHLLDFYWRCSLSPGMYMKLSELEKYLSDWKIHLSERERYLSERERHLSERERFEQEKKFSEQEKNLSEQEKNLSEQVQPSWEDINELSNTTLVIANATELQKTAGIEFEKFEDNGHFGVTFSKRPPIMGVRAIMVMPRLKIDSRQKTLLINLIAFENCILPYWRIYSCYMKLMDALIDTEKDVALLQKCGVIFNTLSSHEMAATFFNDIGNFCFIGCKTNCFSGLYKNVQEYYNSTLNRRRVSLQQKYFSSPWAGISVFAAATLLFLSALQTFYTVVGYLNRKK